MVGTGVDPVTSRFSVRNAGKAKSPGRWRNREAPTALRSSRKFAVFLTRVGTPWARNFTNLKYRNPTALKRSTPARKVVRASREPTVEGQIRPAERARLGIPVPVVGMAFFAHGTACRRCVLGLLDVSPDLA